MKRKQKRFLQMTLLFMVALIFLPNIGLWSLYKEKHLVKSPEPAEPQVSAAQRRIPEGQESGAGHPKQVCRVSISSQVFAELRLQSSRDFGV